jgi:glycosyltransferase involved in cell wall biosynthesis
MRKIAIYYDSLISQGGAERVVIQLANHLNADIITSGYNPEITKWMPIKGRVIDLGNFSMKFFKPLGILFEAPLRYIFNNKSQNYDINIYCGFTSIYGAKKGKTNIWRCFTPNRIMYDLKEEKQKNSGLLKRLAFTLHVFLFNKLDQSFVKNRFDKILVQSKNVQKRIKKYYDINAGLIYDPVDTKNYHFKKYGDFYLSVSRLFPEKRVEMIVDAFLEMPDKKLIIVGDGPDKATIMKKIKNAKNIQILTNVSENKLFELYANCIATVYMPKNEDYGLIPLESMAAGKPCIAANEGGCKETVINGKTGMLINADKEHIIAAVKKLNPETVKKMKNDCLEQAKKFDVANSFKQWDLVITTYK